MITEITQPCFAALIEPSVETYKKIYNLRYASLQDALIWIIASALLSILLNITGAALLPYHLSNTTSTLYILIHMQWLANPWIQIILAIWIVPAFFLLRVFTQHAIAQALGGKSEIGRYSYVIAIINAPFTLLYALLSWLPLGYPGSPTYIVILAILTVYQYSLTIAATKGVYTLSTGRSIVAVLGVICLFFLLGACAVLFFSVYIIMR